LGLPLRHEPYESPAFFPFFEGMLPEGWYLDIVSKTLKVDPEDRFGLLLATASAGPFPPAGSWSTGWRSTG
jgi:serine/threonine-protein kinase HipA